MGHGNVRGSLGCWCQGRRVWSRFRCRKIGGESLVVVSGMGCPRCIFGVFGAVVNICMDILFLLPEFK
jgi:hypothetical protein